MIKFSRKNKAKIVSFLDCFFIKNKKKILFVVKNKTEFSGNLRVLLEKFLAKHDNYIFYVYKDGIFPEKLRNELESINVTVLEKFTLRSFFHIVTSKTIILSHNPRDAHITKKCFKRKIINLWHGVAIKKIECLMPSIDREKKKLLDRNSQLYDLVIASSDIDKITNAQAFGVDESKVKVTGLPRYELLDSSYPLSSLLHLEEIKIQQLKGDKKLILYAPTFREQTISAIQQITKKEWLLLEEFAQKFNLLIGVRPHPYDVKHLPSFIEKSENFCLFNNENFTEVNIILRNTDVLLVDFSSIWVDYLLLKRPILGFAKDYTHYLEQERGFIYSFQQVFPSFFLDDIENLLVELEKVLIAKKEKYEYHNALEMFHKYKLGCQCSENVYYEIKKIISP